MPTRSMTMPILLAAALVLGACNPTIRRNEANAMRSTPVCRGLLFRTSQIAGEARRYALYVPREYDPAQAWPLVVFLNGKGERQAAGLRGKGPQAGGTDLGILEPDVDGELVLTALHPGVAPEKARENTGWPLRAASNLRVTEPPTEKELEILRQELDPQHIYLK